MQRLSTRDASSTMRRLYRDVWAYEIPKQDESRFRQSGSASTYGEIMPTALGRLIEYLDLGPDDVFYDLGSGSGKVVIQVGLMAPVGRAVGVELSPTRHGLAQQVLTHAQHEGLLPGGRCEFRNQDMLEADLRDATCVYTCSTAFSESFMLALVQRLASLRDGLRLVTTQELDPHPAFRELATLRLDMSWKRRSEVHVYRLHRGRKRPRAFVGPA